MGIPNKDQEAGRSGPIQIESLLQLLLQNIRRRKLASIVSTYVLMVNQFSFDV